MLLGLTKRKSVSNKLLRLKIDTVAVSQDAFTSVQQFSEYNDI